ncbi:JmjC domain-containing histone demethylation protein 1 [Vermiconidia calcicola]|uniref:JmjC domain-containing histone demethylation protein 1 n=1 Tax=Vermiconidia calcicola TaxID=1690605 RepID=A0ACC3N504_9PEZI|nr:JmjC domain-containing histone demethylation protein 1 [Vermiconidia calcicola]
MQPYNPPQSAYQIPSLEQIANEVLVDMNGNEYHEQGAFPQQFDGLEQVRLFNAGAADIAPLSNGDVKPDESVDSAVSLPTPKVVEQHASDPNITDSIDTSMREVDTAPSPDNIVLHHELPPAQPSIETDSARDDRAPASPTSAPNEMKDSVSSLPLYQPPAPLSRSPEMSKRQPVMSNGMVDGTSSLPVEATPHKRKRDSTSATPGAKSAKKARLDGAAWQGSIYPSFEHGGEDLQSLELAKMLQQEDLGLRRRSK